MASLGEKQLGKQADQLLPVTAVIVSFFRHKAYSYKKVEAVSKIANRLQGQGNKSD
jgi:hypothetical protein